MADVTTFASDERNAGGASARASLQALPPLRHEAVERGDLLARYAQVELRAPPDDQRFATESARVTIPGDRGAAAVAVVGFVDLAGVFANRR
jgi:hypothetical protein